MLEKLPNSKQDCPRCSVPFAGAAIGKDRLEQCPECGGVFVGLGTFQKICVDQDVQAAALALSLPPAPPVAAHKPYLKCPQCQELMNRCNFARRSGVITSVCKPHGIWLDRNGLRQIIEFIRAGGLERAQAAELEEQKMAKAAKALDDAIVFHDDGYHSRF